MILRQWKGVAKEDQTENYINHLLDVTFPNLSEISGFTEAKIFKRSTEKGMEFLILTAWENMEAIKSFAGEQVDSAVVPKEVESMMVEYDKNVYHYDLVRNYPIEKVIKSKIPH